MKRMVILGSVVVLGLLVLALSLVVFWAWRSNKAADTEVVIAATKVGTPKGQKITKEIDASGGALVSPDGRLTVTIPENAVKEKTAFSVQPISNEAPNGLGLGYRIEPSGKTFATPLVLAIRYDDSDLKETIP